MALGFSSSAEPVFFTVVSDNYLFSLQAKQEDEGYGVDRGVVRV